MTGSTYADQTARRRWRTLSAAVRLATCAQRMYVSGGGSMDDALNLIKDSSVVYRFARRDGVLGAARAGATDEEIAIALGMSMPETRDLIDHLCA
ncbi:hypothetical protein ACFXKK_35805 [Streptomyces globisporus]|uniref:hypothetical protein n=1 Tax=Streptomyces globisporus TaxID=1908 RepID=UPI00365BACF7